MTFRTILASLLCIALSACNWQAPPTEKEAIGTYRGKYAGGAVEAFRLLPGGRFEQELTVGGRLAYKNEGSWRIDRGFIAFDKIFIAVEMGSNRVLVPKERTNNLRGLWVSLNGRRRIVFDIDHEYLIDGQSTKEELESR